MQLFLLPILFLLLISTTVNLLKYTPILLEDGTKVSGKLYNFGLFTLFRGEDSISISSLGIVTLGFLSNKFLLNNLLLVGIQVSKKEYTVKFNLLNIVLMFHLPIRIVKN